MSVQTESKVKELWYREPLTYTIDGEDFEGWYHCFVRLLEVDETFDDVDEQFEYEQLIDGTSVPSVVDENYEEVEDYDDVNHSGEFEFFIGDEDGKPTDETN